MSTLSCIVGQGDSIVRSEIRRVGPIVFRTLELERPRNLCAVFRP